MNAGAKTLRRAKYAGFRIPLRTLRHFFATFAVKTIHRKVREENPL
jgi:hypothetical protein